MKNSIILTIILLLSLKIVLSQGHCEMTIKNEAGAPLFIKAYPFSMVFNWAYEDFTRKPGYNIIARTKRNTEDYRYDYISGDIYDKVNSKVITTHKVDGGLTLCGQFDGESGGSSSETDFCYGSGVYRFDFWLWDTLEGNETRTPDDWCTVEFDGNPYSPWIDLAIYFYGINNIQFDLGNHCGIHPIPANHNIEIWRPCESFQREKAFDTPWGPFKYDKGTLTGFNPTPNPYTVLPQEPRILCTPTYLPSAPNENHYFQQNEVGVLTLNLTIEKNDANSNPVEITTPTSAPFALPPPQIIITGLPGTITGAILKVAKGANNQERILRFKKYNTGNYGTNLWIQNYGRLQLVGSDYESERSHVYFENYCNIEVEANGMILMDKNSQLSLQGNSHMKLDGHSKLVGIGNPKPQIQIMDNAIVEDCGTDFNGGILINIIPNVNWIYRPENCNDYLPELSTKIIDSGSAIILSGTLTVGINCKIIFDGEDSYLQADPGASVLLCEGASIEFKNGAYISADGCTFTNLNSGDIWSGIKLDGAGSQSVIKNCTFNNASTSIEIVNTQCEISDNEINVPENVTGAAGITATNVTNINLYHNTINMGPNASAAGISFFNYEGEGAPGGGGSSYSLNVINNFINGGAYPITISCLTASQLPFYLNGNQINPVNSINSYGLFAYNITGNIKVNSFVNSYNSQAVTLQQCSLNMFDNYFQSNNASMMLQSSSTVQMAPIQNLFTQWLWIGGNNTVNSNLSNCIGFSAGSNPIISPRGNNCFTVFTQPNYHITGEYCLNSTYDAYNNYWEPQPGSQSFDIECEYNPVPVNYISYYTECPLTIGDIVGYEITDLGNGFYDTVYITSGGGGGSYPGNIKVKKMISPGALYYEAISKRKQGDFAGAITKCREILDNHDSSKYFISTLSELYLNYLESDTIRNQNITNGLFNALKSYINQKMQQYSNKLDFIEKAYKYFLMCLVKSKNFSEAISGYENIMSNHSDPVVRLNASWDRSAVILLMGQGGGIDSRLRGNDNSRSMKLLDKNPSHRIASELFEKEKVKKEKQNIISDKSTNIKYTKEEKERINSRAEKFNPVSLIELKYKINLDVKLLNEINQTKSNKIKNVKIPLRFKLNQNFPNPFNPVTEIKFELPKSSSVSVKIYNAIGELVKTLINNEYRVEGEYSVKFDGTNFASGIYFYSLETKDYKETKKMILIK